MPANTGLAKISREYDSRFPNLPNKTLARKLHSDMPNLFKSVEAARDSVRAVRGARGKDLRREMKDISFTEQAFKKVLSEFSNGEHFGFKPFVIPKNIKKLGIIGDEQIPFHDKNAIDVAMEYFYKKGVDAILLNGDQADNYQLSKFLKDPKKRNFREELEEVRGYFKWVRKMFSDKVIYHKKGNHELRWETYLKTFAPVLFDSPEFQWDIIMKLGESQIQCIDDKIRVEFGKLNILHGHEIRGSGGVNPARWIFLKGHANTAINHFHRISGHIDRDLEGNQIGCWSIGCMCDLNAEYMPYNNWSHGFGFVERISDQGHFRFKNIQVENYEIV